MSSGYQRNIYQIIRKLKNLRMEERSWHSIRTTSTASGDRATNEQPNEVTNQPTVRSLIGRQEAANRTNPTVKKSGCYLDAKQPVIS